MRLEDIGFYSLSEERAANSGSRTPMWRCEIVLTDRCNFNCPYCRGLREDCVGDMSLDDAKRVLDWWAVDGLKCVRFSGGEPTLWTKLDELVVHARALGVEHIAVSSNGSLGLPLYRHLTACGVNDWSISLDVCCSAIGGEMTGRDGVTWEHTVSVIRQLARTTYVTVGMVFTEQNVGDARDAVMFAHSLGVADIRVLSAAQYDKVLGSLCDLPDVVLDAHPILAYRVNRFRAGVGVRGLSGDDPSLCPLVIDDSAVASGKHFPCIIYMREHGDPIGLVGPGMRKERIKWFAQHNTHEDPICKQNCLDVCVDYNRRWHGFPMRHEVAGKE